MILIRDAYIIDGTGAPKKRGDVLIKNNVISAIGKLPRKHAKTVIDGSHGFVTPGFIDINNDSDHYLTLFSNPSHADLLKQGITTIMCGNSGASLAPLLYGSLESIRKWSLDQDINVNWHTVKEFLRTLERQKFGVNFGTLAGHSTIRRGLIGSQFRDLSVKETMLFIRLVHKAMKEGAFGLSLGLSFAHTKHVPFTELKSLASAVQSRDGVLSVQLRDEGDALPRAMEEVFRLAKETGVNLLISQFLPTRSNKKEFTQSFAYLEENAKDINIHFASHLFDSAMVPIYRLLPQWAQSGRLEDMFQNLVQKHTYERILKDLPGMRGEDIFVAQAPGMEYLQGETLARFCENHGTTLRHGLLKLMETTHLRAVVFHRRFDTTLAMQSLKSPYALMGTNAPSFGDAYADINHDRKENLYPRFLNRISELNLLTREAAIQKITSIPAKKFSLHRRGVLKEGNIADVVLYKDGKVSHTIVNGEIAVLDGKFTNLYAGEILRFS